MVNKLMDAAPIIAVDGLTKRFSVRRWPLGRAQAVVSAVDGVSFHVGRGEGLGLVGASGAGKSTVVRLLLKLLAPDEGSMRFDIDGTAHDVAALAGQPLRAFRRATQAVFQDPYEALDPRWRVLDSVAEPLAIHGGISRREREELALEMLGRVGLTPLQEYAGRYPHELSGGQRQRVAIARALVAGPAFVAADEPTSMLDAPVRVQTVRLLRQAQEHTGLAYLYVTHDLALARYACDRIIVMQEGRIVESGATEEIISHPQHAYTQALIAAHRGW